MVRDFKRGDTVEFCGIRATVVENYGRSGIVEVPGEGRMVWWWHFGGTDVTLVESEGI